MHICSTSLKNYIIGHVHIYIHTKNQTFGSSLGFACTSGPFLGFFFTNSQAVWKNIMSPTCFLMFNQSLGNFSRGRNSTRSASQNTHRNSGISPPFHPKKLIILLWGSWLGIGSEFAVGLGRAWGHHDIRSCSHPNRKDL